MSPGLPAALARRKLIEQLADRLARHPAVERVWLLGSRARGDNFALGQRGRGPEFDVAHRLGAAGARDLSADALTPRRNAGCGPEAGRATP